MKKINSLICSLALAGICFNATAQNKDATVKDAGAKESPVNTQQASSKDAEKESMMVYMAVGPMHEMLAKSSGQWNQQVTIWTAPASAPTKNPAKCTTRMIMGGRYQESKSSGTFDGMSFEGTSITGYDNAKKVFVSTWIDNMGTGIVYSEGKYDERSRTINFTGNMVDPATGKDIQIRETLKTIDDNNQLLEMFMMLNGKEFKNMEIKFTRAL